MYRYRADKIRTFRSALAWESAEILHRTCRKIQTPGVSPASSRKSDAPTAPSSMIAARHCGRSSTAANACVQAATRGWRGLLSAKTGHWQEVTYVCYLERFEPRSSPRPGQIWSLLAA